MTKEDTTHNFGHKLHKDTQLLSSDNSQAIRILYLSHLKAVSDDAVSDTTAWSLVATAICIYATV